MNSKLKEIYDKVEYSSIKYDSYFHVYENQLQKYVGCNITLVEVGVFNGGSLFMWRDFLGVNARIIGIDLNPAAKIWEKHGFEIYIGDQSADEFWLKFYQMVGKVDVLIDDGGHTNQQQIVTAHHAIQNIKDGGLLIVEDVHTNYFREFGNPSRYSFIKFVHKLVDAVNSRSFALKRTFSKYSSRIYSVTFFESIVAIQIDSHHCYQSTATTNNGKSQGATDFRYQGPITNALFQLKNRYTSNQRISARLVKRAVDLLLSVISRATVIRYKKYFKDIN